MTDVADYRDDLADALEACDWTVVDTFGDLEGSPHSSSPSKTSVSPARRSSVRTSQW
ncbi:hypothetical protein [Halospeciosus flavus]|uniref:hypothetical protein n=1 Tax=Halospeciosus flavus TaxID=3032283 RepID=UPI00361C4B48